MWLLLALLQADDLEARLARKPVVQLRLRDIPLSQAFEEITRQSGVEFQLDPQLASGRVTLEGEGWSPHEAAHALCWAHGSARVLFSTYSKKVHIGPGTAARPPTYDSGPFHFVLSNLLLTRSQSFDEDAQRRMSVTLWLAWSDAAPPASLAEAVVTEALDDTGRNLKRTREPLLTRLLGKPVSADVVTLLLDHPSMESRRIKSLKGYREATFIQETRPLRIDVSEKLPLASKDGEVTLRSLARAKTGLTAVFEGPRPAAHFPLPDHCRDLVFLDEEGRKYPVRITTTAGGEERTTFEVICPNIPESAKIVACETSFVVRWLSKKIVFEFLDVDLP